VTRIIYELRDGTQREVEAEVGASVMAAAVQAGVPGIVGECSGEMSCATCHVYLKTPEGFWTSSVDETDLLEMADDVTEESRLSCQLKVTADMEKVVVEVVGE
jgi:ferredoxin, 2Fe-2S